MFELILNNKNIFIYPIYHIQTLQENYFGLKNKYTGLP